METVFSDATSLMLVKLVQIQLDRKIAPSGADASGTDYQLAGIHISL